MTFEVPSRARAKEFVLVDGERRRVGQEVSIHDVGNRTGTESTTTVALASIRNVSRLGSVLNWRRFAVQTETMAMKCASRAAVSRLCPVSNSCPRCKFCRHVHHRLPGEKRSPWPVPTPARAIVASWTHVEGPLPAGRKPAAWRGLQGSPLADGARDRSAAVVGRANGCRGLRATRAGLCGARGSHNSDAERSV